MISRQLAWFLQVLVPWAVIGPWHIFHQYKYWGFFHTASLPHFKTNGTWEPFSIQVNRRINNNSTHLNQHNNTTTKNYTVTTTTANKSAKNNHSTTMMMTMMMMKTTTDLV
jgi:hypothetical protein